MPFPHMAVATRKSRLSATAISECKITIFFCNNSSLSTKKSILRPQSHLFSLSVQMAQKLLGLPQVFRSVYSDGA